MSVHRTVGEPLRKRTAEWHLHLPVSPACMFALTTTWANAQMDEYNIKAGYLYNFSRYVRGRTAPLPHQLHRLSSALSARTLLETGSTRQWTWESLLGYSTLEPARYYPSNVFVSHRLGLPETLPLSRQHII